jgi:hypothetical protein
LQRLARGQSGQRPARSSRGEIRRDRTLGAGRSGAARLASTLALIWLPTDPTTVRITVPSIADAA